MDPQASAADLHAVQNHIIGDSADFGIFPSLEQRGIFSLLACERMVNRIPFLFLIAPGEKREVDDPEEVQLRGIFDEFQNFGNAQPDPPERFAGGFPLVRAE